MPRKPKGTGPIVHETFDSFFGYILQPGYKLTKTETKHLASYVRRTLRRELPKGAQLTMEQALKFLPPDHHTSFAEYLWEKKLEAREASRDRRALMSSGQYVPKGSSISSLGYGGARLRPAPLLLTRARRRM